MGCLRECLCACRVQKLTSKCKKLTNEIKILNHEKIKNEELTVMLQMARQMISCSSRKSTPKSEGKMGVFGTQ
jgi:hypothetical protein